MTRFPTRLRLATDPAPLERRIDALLRELVGMTQLAIERGELTIDDAAAMLIRFDVPMRTVRDVLNRAQQQDVVAEWPKLCESVMPRYEPAD